MTMNCKEICHQYKAKKPILPDTRYGNGQKRCKECGIFIEWDGIRCPCCSGKLRSKPKFAGARHQLMIHQKIKRY